MRKLLWLTILAGIAYGGYWFIGSRAVLGGVEAALAELKAEGVADVAAVNLVGFPSRFDVTLSEPHLISADGQAAWQAPFIQFFALSYRPNHVIAVWPHDQTITLGREVLAVKSSNLRASAAVTAGLTLPLEKATVEGHGLGVQSSFGWSVLAENLIFASRLVTDGQNSHEVALVIDGLAPGDDLRRLIDPAGSLPATAEEVKLDATLSFDRAIDRTLTRGSLHLTGVTGIAAKIVWGKMQLQARGDLGADAEGFAAGRVEISVRNWRDMYAVFVRAGAVKPEISVTIENALDALAKGSGDADLLKLPLIFQSGRMWLGPILLGPAPRF